MHRSRRVIGLISGVAVLGCLALSSSTQAAVYCFPDTAVDPSCTMGNTDSNLQNVLTAANSTNATADTLLIGAGTHMLPGNQSYIEQVNAADTLQIVGAGVGTTTLQVADSTGFKTTLAFDAPAGSTLSDLTVLMPANISNTDVGLSVGGSVAASDISINGTATINSIGAFLHGGTLDDSVVDMGTASNYAVRNDTTSATITDTQLTGSTVADEFGTGTTLTIDRSRLMGPQGTTMDNGTIDMRNSVIDLGSFNGARGIQAVNGNEGQSAMNVNADHVTIVGGGPGSIGVLAVGDSNGGVGVFGSDPMNGINDGETPTINLSNSVISGPETALYLAADRDEVANLSTSYSNYSAPVVNDNDNTDGGSTGTTNLSETNKTTLAMPGFTVDFHLMPTSPLIDIGSPAAPASSLDIDQDARALDGSFDCTFIQRQDIGADEYAGAMQGIAPGCNPVLPTPVPTTPTTTTATPTAAPKRKCKKRKKKPAAAAKKCKKKRR